MKSTCVKKFLAASLLTALAATPALALEGKWITGDFHQHSYVSDGSYSISTVQQKGFDFGLDWQANSEHGGTSDEAGDEPRRKWSSFLDSPRFLGSPNPYPKLWRWQTLADSDKVPADLNAIRAANRGKIVINGLELNMPGADHCSTAIVDPTGRAIAKFEYLWDNNDKDTSGGYGFDPAGTKNLTNNLAKAAQAAAWMQKNYAGKGWMIPAHPERAADRDWSDGNPSGYGPNFLRTLNDAGPDVFFAFESAPGHQKEKERGGYGAGAFGGGTFGGVGHFAATVGGLWDALLGEGRRFWLVANSDFHSTDGDFWPGEYQKTHSYLTDANGNGEWDGEDVVASLRSGNIFVTHGDLIDGLQFTLRAPEKQSVTMGQTLNVPRNGQVEVTVLFKSPAANNCKAGVNAPSAYLCQPPSVQQVQIIAGDVTGKKVPGSAAYAKDGSNPSAKVVATCVGASLKEKKDGYSKCSFTMNNVQNDMYFRVRGSNLPPNTRDETDEAGNPLSDTLVRRRFDLDGAAKAWSDLWFYSNPVFVKVAK